MSDLGNSVGGIRGAYTGNLIQLLYSSKGKSMGPFRNKVGKVLGEPAEVRIKKYEITTESRNLDEVTSQEDRVWRYTNCYNIINLSMAK